MKIYEEFSDEQKRAAKILALIFLFLVNVLLLGVFASYAFSAWKDWRGSAGPRLQVSFQGEGKVTAKPDVAKLQITVISDNKVLAYAEEDNTKRANAVIGFLKTQGIAEKDIKTTAYYVSPRYSYRQPCPGSGPCQPIERDKIIGYKIQNSVDITVRDIAKVGEVIDGVVESGVDQISSLQFTIDDPDQLKSQARDKAVADASKKAERLAGQLGKQVGKIVAFSESGRFPPVIFGREALLGKGGDLGGELPRVEPGENEVTVLVSITYELR